ncbi:MAG: rRNA 2-O-methyl-C2498 methyltransferase RlmM, partial [Myxococcaceae bacterium]|nr:rRNA 2-O-methyl-C2498 methyltransferase RlmM [Myxococcaceae bacterium]
LRSGLKKDGARRLHPRTAVKSEAGRRGDARKPEGRSALTRKAEPRAGDARKDGKDGKDSQNGAARHAGARRAEPGERVARASGRGGESRRGDTRKPEPRRFEARGEARGEARAGVRGFSRNPEARTSESVRPGERVHKKPRKGGDDVAARVGRKPAGERFAGKGDARKPAGKGDARKPGGGRFAKGAPRRAPGEHFPPKGDARRKAERVPLKADARKGAARFAPKGERGERGERGASARFAPKGDARKLDARGAGKSEPREATGTRFKDRAARRGSGDRFPRKPDAASADTQTETAGVAKPRARAFSPRTSLPLSLLRADKPVERKRPDMSEEPHPGHYLLTCREGSEQDLVDELVLAGIVDPPPRILAPALVLAPKVPKLEKRPVELTFARQGFPIVQSVHAHDLDEVSHRISRSLKGQLERAKEYALHVWVPDSELGNPLAAMAIELEEKVVAQLEAALPEAKRVEDSVLRRQGSMLFAQVCLIDPERAVAGVTYSNAALSLARGGRTRVRVIGHFPSRAARKIEEAFAWLNLEPGAGELCVDLGAAPGGWTYVLAERRARVIAVDPAQLRPEILAKKGVSHVQQSAFDYKPEAEVDWLFCDMAWRPLEAAALLAKWGRNRWARLMIANIKLPMTKKAEIVARVKHILETEGDWKNIRVKQLYHDRDEVTLSAHVK